MAGGWSKDGAVQDQIDASTKDSVKQVRSQIPSGESLKYCANCEEPIPQARREALPGVRLCIECQTELDSENRARSTYNRRGSKDSQLR